MTTARRVEILRAEVDGVLASRNSARSMDDFQKYRGDPVAFARQELNAEPYDKQCEVLESLVSNKRTVVAGCHGSGKEFVLSCALLYHAYVLRQMCVALSATEDQLLTQLWKEVRARFNPDRLPGILYSGELRINGEARIVTRTSSQVSSITGYHDAHGVFFCISEGQGEQCESAAYDAAAACTIDDLSRTLVAGNPVKPVGKFYETCNKPGWNRITISAFDHPNIRQGAVVIPGGPSPTWPAEMAEEWGLESAWYQGRVLGMFPQTVADALCTRAQIDRAFERHSSGQFAVRANNRVPRLVADIARGGPDSTVVGTVRGPILQKLEVWEYADLMETARNLHARALELGHYRLARPRPTPEELLAAAVPVTIDDVGIGSGCSDRVRELGGKVIAFNGAHRASDETRYANRRSESYMELADGLKRNTVALPPDEKLAEELLATTFSVNGAGKIQLDAKDFIKKRLNPQRSPDRGDVASMSALASRPSFALGRYVI